MEGAFTGFNFERQVEALQNICQTNIFLAEQANVFLRAMSPRLIADAVAELKNEYEERFLGRRQAYESVKNTLNLLQKEQLTVLDFSFMRLGLQLNAHYGRKHLRLRKTLPYARHCLHCLRYICNDLFHLSYHQRFCPRNPQADSRARPPLSKSQIKSERGVRRRRRRDSRIRIDCGVENYDWLDDNMNPIRGFHFRTHPTHPKDHAQLEAEGELECRKVGGTQRKRRNWLHGPPNEQEEKGVEQEALVEQSSKQEGALACAARLS